MLQEGLEQVSWKKFSSICFIRDDGDPRHDGYAASRATVLPV